MTAQLLKTKMCSFFERGKCASATCRYAHSANELRSAPNLQKTKMCRMFLQGSCKDGENCPYAHGDSDLKFTEGIYKTQICNFWERGHCKKGDRCNHAHGPLDLRPTAPATPQARPRADPPDGGTAPRPQRALPLEELLFVDAEENAKADPLTPARQKATELDNLLVTPLTWQYGVAGLLTPSPAAATPNMCFAQTPALPLARPFGSPLAAVNSPAAAEETNAVPASPLALGEPREEEGHEFQDLSRITASMSRIDAVVRDIATDLRGITASCAEVPMQGQAPCREPRRAALHRI